MKINKLHIKAIRNNGSLAKGQKAAYFWITLLVLLTILSIVVVYFFSSAPPRFRVVKVVANSDLMDYSKPFFVQFGASDTSYAPRVTHMLAEEGDVIELTGYNIRYRGDADSLNIYLNDYRLYTNGVLTGIFFWGDKDILPWLQSVPDDSLKHLEMLGLGTSILNSYLPQLKRIASIRKEINIDFFYQFDKVANRQEITLIGQLFQPSFVSIDLNARDLNLLENYKHLHTLMLSMEPETYGSLPNLPRLKQCILVGDDSVKLMPGFFNRTPAIEQLVVAGPRAIKSDRQIRFDKLKHLRELVLNYKFADIQSIYNACPDLYLLSVGDSAFHTDLFPSFRNLRWAGLPRNIDQKTFDKIIPQMKDLEVLELWGDGPVANYSSLKSLLSLKGLVLAGDVSDVKTLSELKQLRYLSLAGYKLRDTSIAHKLKRALPGTVIVPNSGACLGSGWLLLILPFFLMAVLIQTIASNRIKRS